MSSRDAILASIRSNLPKPNRPLPAVPKFADNPPADFVEAFGKTLTRMGGRIVDPDIAVKRCISIELPGRPLSVVAPIATIHGHGTLVRKVPLASFVAAQKTERLYAVSYDCCANIFRVAPICPRIARPSSVPSRGSSMKVRERPCSTSPQLRSSLNVLQRPVEPAPQSGRSYANRASKPVTDEK